MTLNNRLRAKVYQVLYDLNRPSTYFSLLLYLNNELNQTNIDKTTQQQNVASVRREKNICI